MNKVQHQIDVIYSERNSLRMLGPNMAASQRVLDSSLFNSRRLRAYRDAYLCASCIRIAQFSLSRTFPARQLNFTFTVALFADSNLERCQIVENFVFFRPRAFPVHYSHVSFIVAPCTRAIFILYRNFFFFCTDDTLYSYTVIVEYAGGLIAVVKDVYQ